MNLEIYNFTCGVKRRDIDLLYIMNNSSDPFFNHAVEEYIINNLDEEVFMLWINKPAILIGRNQNTMSEIEIDYVRDNEIEVVRRLSGGGTVYNDYGIMNFTFITYKSSDPLNDGFEKFARPVIEALNSLGVKAEFTGRNDILIDGKKICGNAQYCTQDKILHHGTLLYNGNLEDLKYALKSREIKFVDKSVKSVGSRVTKIYDHIEDKSMDLLKFREYLKDYVMDIYNIDKVYNLSEEELVEIEKIADSRFRTWEWTYGKSPSYSYKNEIKYPNCGVVEYNLNIKNGKIDDISIYGDFFGEKNISELEESIKGNNFEIDCLKNCLSKVNLGDYIRNLSREDFLKGLMDIK